ncbi:HAMP domain-containing histidine kinase [Priestia filamentosa]|uniref:sensor histidine kinase n=1 Tax=Priestia filamentosa TaxID=1402861 RepID=UPI001FB5523A|nr:HAMP domain-containing sensor histidine kinase [Priestia filamentosa]MED3726371.1 HAMP domain-containing sensor histidine kinase [Priestia filamentosa]UOE62440.1 HAMP domain-containing histidine kinase [Priestia filamentosa]
MFKKNRGKKIMWIWIILSLILICVGIVMPYGLNVEQRGLEKLMINMEKNPHGNTLLILAFAVVASNTIHALPIYLGTILLGNEIGELLNKNWVKIIIPLFLIPPIYIVINTFTEFKPHFGTPALLVLLFIILTPFFEKRQLGFFMRSIILIHILFGVQWLDEVPFLTQYGFGHGPISSKVKQWAIEMSFNQTLSLYAIVLCSIFIVNAFILTGYMVRWKIVQEFHQIELEALESRSNKEALNLVHDLKTPLASMEGLISLISLYNNHSKVSEYCHNITLSINSMNKMISEILYNNHMSTCSLKELVDYILSSRLSGTDKKINLELPDKSEDIMISINKIRITRAIVNLINNAFDAIKDIPKGKVTIKTKVQGDQLLLGVSDNGVGISTKERDKIWQAGYSTKHQSGIGLSFVYQVAKEHNGKVSVESSSGQETVFWIHLLGGLDNENSSH